MASGKAILHASFDGPLLIPLQPVPSPKSSSGAEAGICGFLSSANMDSGVPLASPQGSQASSQVDTCTTSFLPSCSSSVRLPITLTQDLWFSFQAFPKGCYTCQHCVNRYSGRQSKQCRELRFPWSGLRYLGVFWNFGTAPGVLLTFLLRAPPQDATGTPGILSRLSRERNPHLKRRRGKRFFS